MSEHTKQNIEEAFHRALRGGVTRAPDDVCTIAPAAVDPKLQEQSGGNLLVITISSFVFRLLTLFQVATDAATRAYYGSGAAGQGIDEAFHEIANLCCGALNRELSQQFPHLAMSIPYTLSSRCMAFLGDLRPQYVSSSAITINDSVHVQATLCMCCSAPVEFTAGAVAIENNSGELELF
jgi:hypothetical protein